jgi:hypothetical protein
LTLIASATVALSRLSSAASAETAIAAVTNGPIAARSTNPSDGTGNPAGSAPSRIRCPGISADTPVAAATANNEYGAVGCQRAPTSMIAATVTATSSGNGCGLPANRRAASAAIAQTLSPCAPVTPRAAGTCCRAMTTAIPAVNPSTTGNGR